MHAALPHPAPAPRATPDTTRAPSPPRRGPATTARLAALLTALVAALAACASDARRPGGGGGPDGGAFDAAGFDGGAFDAGAFDGGDVDGGGADLGPGVDAGPATDAGRDAGPVPIPSCQRTCVVASDCGSGTPATDTDNFACSGGLCSYLGCRSDDECVATFGAGGDDWRCVAPAGGGVPTCTRGCVAPGDCASPSPAVDADNYACEAGACRYLGCLNDAECTATFGTAGGTWRCRDVVAGLPPSCVEACTAPADCASPSPAVDADNHACEAGLCRYLGCLSDAECDATFGARSGDYTCR